jgi:3-dehydroquinate synthase
VVADFNINVGLAERSYNIYIKKGILSQSVDILRPWIAYRKILLITDSNVSELYMERVVEILNQTGADVETFVFTAGEASKTLETLADIYKKAVSCGIDRSSCIVALGGGVTGDLAGFAAASYMRGIDFIQIPTTLLAMVDSSVGGKTGVDLPEGKNLVGAFWQPKLVLIDPEFMKTLPDREIRCGLAEVVKYGVILDEKLFDTMIDNVDKLIAPDYDFYSQIVSTCCQLKTDVVVADEREGGLRAILNYGHTFGHAVESVSGYEQYQHGEGVAIGMCMAADLALELGMFSDGEADKQQKLLEALELPCRVTGCDPDEIFAAMSKDKKVQSGKLRVVLPENIGKVRIVGDVDPELIAEVVRRRCD